MKEISLVEPVNDLRSNRENSQTHCKDYEADDNRDKKRKKDADDQRVDL